MLSSSLPFCRSWPLAGRWLSMVVAVLGMPLVIADDARAESPGIEAIDQFKTGHSDRTAVENRFFLKEKRFELAPMLGYVPNNPYAKRYTGGVVLGYHFNETLSAQAQVFVSPDLKEADVKGLVGVLLQRAYNSSADADVTFQQPLDKVTLGANFGVAWAPFYGKINLVGETVLNLDFYVYGGAGMVSKNDYYATYDEVGAAAGDPVTLTPPTAEVKVGPYIGLGQNYFLNRFMAFKLDVRAAFWVDNKPAYAVGEVVTESQVYNNVILGGGLAFFLPNMKPRLYDF